MYDVSCSAPTVFSCDLKIYLFSLENLENSFFEMTSISPGDCFFFGVFFLLVFGVFLLFLLGFLMKLFVSLVWFWTFFFVFYLMCKKFHIFAEPIWTSFYFKEIFDLKGCIYF